jgi:tetratricopeptide (TPR) repeat protein
MKILLIKLVLLMLISTAYTTSAQDATFAMSRKQWEKAIGLYTDLAKTNSTDQMIQLALASAYLANGEKDKSKAACETAFAAKPEGAYAYIAKGRILLLQNKEAEAEVEFAKASKSGRKDINALRTLAESFLYSNKPNLNRAETLLKAALGANSKDITTLLSLGYCFREMPNNGLAAQQYELVESLDAKNLIANYMLAKLYAENESELGRAEKHVLKYIELAVADPVKNKKDLTDGYHYLAYVHYKKHDTAKAKEWVEKALAIDPENNNLHELKTAIEGGESGAKLHLPVLLEKD